MSQSNIFDYEDVFTYIKRSDSILIDVREPKERQEKGFIPESINIPIGELINTLENSNPNEFKTKHGKDLPNKNSYLIFTCNTGGRASKATEAALHNGFVNSKVYKGGWKEWSSRQQ